MYRHVLSICRLVTSRTLLGGSFPSMCGGKKTYWTANVACIYFVRFKSIFWGFRPCVPWSSMYLCIYIYIYILLCTCVCVSVRSVFKCCPKKGDGHRKNSLDCLWENQSWYIMMGGWPCYTPSQKVASAPSNHLMLQESSQTPAQ